MEFARPDIEFFKTFYFISDSWLCDECVSEHLSMSRFVTAFARHLVARFFAQRQ